MEFGLIAIPFFFITIATTDLGRYFLTQHSLRTLTSEAARAVMVNCFNATASCSLTSAQKTVAEAKTPFLIPGSTQLTATQSAPAAGTGLRTVNVTAVYPFNFVFYQWSADNGNIIETASVSY